jgi:hypothetical protein
LQPSWVSLQRYLLYCSWVFLVCGYHTYIPMSVNALVLVCESFFSLSCKRCPFYFWLFDQHDARGRVIWIFFKLHEMTLLGIFFSTKKYIYTNILQALMKVMNYEHMFYNCFGWWIFDVKTCKFKCGGEKTK